MSYPTERLGKYIDIFSGFAFKSKDFSDSGVPVIKIKNITPPYVSLDDITYVSNDIASQQKKFQVHYDDILIALTGSHINQMASVVGRIAKVKFFDKALLNQRVGKIYTVDAAACNLDYVYYFLSQGKVKIELASKAGGAANQANISPADIKKLQIPFPTKEKQDRIADILLTYDHLIENNQKQIRLLEEAAQRLYKEWFVDLRFPGHETTPVVDGVPEGWHQGTLEELISINYGKDHKQVPEDGEIPVYGSGGLIRKCNKFLYTGEAVLIPRKGSLNHIMYVNEAFWTVDTMFYATMKKPNTALFVYFFISSFDMYAMNIGAAVPSMTVKILEAIPLLIPSENALKRFDDTVKVYFQKIAVLNKQIEGLAEARDRLLPKLMSGEIEV